MFWVKTPKLEVLNLEILKKKRNLKFILLREICSTFSKSTQKIFKKMNFRTIKNTSWTISIYSEQLFLDQNIHFKSKTHFNLRIRLKKKSTELKVLI